MTRGQSWNPTTYAHHAAFVSEFGMPVVELLAPRPGERILDLGCGDGTLARRIADLGCRVTGLDSSPEFVAAARSLGIDAHLADGQELRFDGEFDAVFSNAALHWMKRADDVIAGVWRALRPGGRFVAEFGGKGNVATIVAALNSALRRRGIDPATANPWYFPGVPEYRARLEARGFEVRYIELIPRPTPLPGDITGWLDTFAQSFLGAVPRAERAACMQEVRGELAGRLCDGDGNWVADYVRLRLAAYRPANIPPRP